MNGWDRRFHYIVCAFQTHEEYAQVLTANPHLQKVIAADWDAERDGPSKGDFNKPLKQRRNEMIRSFNAAATQDDSDDEQIDPVLLTKKGRAAREGDSSDEERPRKKNKKRNGSKGGKQQAYSKGGSKLGEYGVRHIGDGAPGDNLNSDTAVPTGATEAAPIKHGMEAQYLFKALVSNLQQGAEVGVLAEQIAEVSLAFDLGGKSLAEHVAMLASKTLPDVELSQKVLFVSAILAADGPTPPPAASAAPSSACSSSSLATSSVCASSSSSAAEKAAIEEHRVNLKTASMLGGFGNADANDQSSTARGRAMMASQMRFVAHAAKANPQYAAKLKATGESERLLFKATTGKALDMGSLVDNAPDAPNRGGDVVGVPSAAAASSGRAAAALTFSDLTLRMVSCAISGKVSIDNQPKIPEVLKVCGVVNWWFKLDSGGEEDYQGVMLALPLGTVKAVDDGLATNPESVIGMLGGTVKFDARRFKGMPHMPSDAAGMQRRLVPFVGFEFSGAPLFTKEHNYFHGDGSEFSPAKYKCLEYVDWL